MHSHLCRAVNSPAAPTHNLVRSVSLCVLPSHVQMVAEKKLRERQHMLSSSLRLARMSSGSGFEVPHSSRMRMQFGGRFSHGSAGNRSGSASPTLPLHYYHPVSVNNFSETFAMPSHNLPSPAPDTATLLRAHGGEMTGHGSATHDKPRRSSDSCIPSETSSPALATVRKNSLGQFRIPAVNVVEPS